VKAEVLVDLEVGVGDEGAVGAEGEEAPKKTKR
jgi:hypothetical protein